jgi:glycosyltransferase involved in cell wall biosynthesis
MRVIARLNIGGPARHTTLLDAGLRRLGYDTLLVYGTPGAGEGSLEHLVDDCAIPAVRVGTLGRRVRPLDDLRSLLAILRILRAHRPRVVHTHTAKGGALGRLAAAIHNATIRRAERAVVVHTFHGHVLEGYFSPAGNHAVRSAERALALLTDAIVAISKSQARDLVERYRVAPAGKVHVVPLGLDLERYLALEPSSSCRARFGLAAEAFVVAFVGRFVPIKNVPMLIDAFESLHRDVPRARLVLAGDGPLASELLGTIRARGLANAVTCLGWVDDLAPLFAATDVVVLTSNNEGTPVALIEAMAAARAVVATRVGGVPDLIRDGLDGRLVPPNAPAALAAALGELARDPDERRRLGTAARAAVREAFGAERLVDDIDRLYVGLLR